MNSNRKHKSRSIKVLDGIPNSAWENLFAPIVETELRNLSMNQLGRYIYMLADILNKSKQQHDLVISAGKMLEEKFNKIQGHIMADPKKYPELMVFLD